MVDSEIVQITVNEAGNQIPVLNPIGDQVGTENVLVSFTISASDPDGNTPALSATSLPIGATLVDNGDGTANFDWTPDFTQAGIHTVTFFASDGLIVDSELVDIIILEAGNQSPVLIPIGLKNTI